MRCGHGYIGVLWLRRKLLQEAKSFNVKVIESAVLRLIFVQRGSDFRLYISLVQRSSEAKFGCRIGFLCSWSQGIQFEQIRNMFAYV